MVRGHHVPSAVGLLITDVNRADLHGRGRKRKLSVRRLTAPQLQAQLSRVTDRRLQETLPEVHGR